MHLMTALLFLLVLARVGGELAGRFGLPAMIGEIAAGVLLGPSVFALVPASPAVLAVSELGVFMLVLLAGMEIDPLQLREAVRGRSLWVAVMGFLVPLTLGVLAGTALGLDANHTVFLAMCAAITALPVSVRLLMDMGRLHSEAGRLIVSAAVVNDVLALLILGVVLDSRSAGDTWRGLALSVVWTLTKTGLFMAVVVGAYRLVMYSTAVVPLSRRLLQKLLDKLRGEETLFALTILFVLLFAGLSESIGLHFVVGAFFGAMILSREILGKVNFVEVQKTASGVTMGFLAPVFFASIGLRFDVGALREWLLVAVVLVVGLGGKLLGGYCGGRLGGFASKRSWALGVGLNGRGTLDLVIANLALVNGFIGPSLFSSLVLLSVLGTLVTPFFMRRMAVHYEDPPVPDAA
jgi:Kef-type K+ transport system membrane component KefB